MLATVLAKIDALSGSLDSRECGIDSKVDFCDEGDYRPVVRRIRRDVEHRDALDRGDRIANCGDNLRTPSLGKIRYALYKLHQAFPLLRFARLTVCNNHVCIAGLPATKDPAVSEGGSPFKSVT